MRYGFIGAGNMGGAILRGALASGVISPKETMVVTATEEKMRELEEELGVSTSLSVEALAKQCEIIIIGVKPVTFEQVLPQIAEAMKACHENAHNKIFISMAAGITIKKMEAFLGEGAKIVRIMPNTPANVQEAMTSVSRNKNVSDEDMKQILDIFNGIGVAREVPEDLIHCVIGVSGSSPAYTYLYIDALAKAAEKNGMKREEALVFAAQSVLGAAKMVLKSEVPPEELCNMVCCKGGTTIEAVTVLKEKGFSELVAEGFQASVDKSILMSKE